MEEGASERTSGHSRNDDKLGSENRKPVVTFPSLFAKRDFISPEKGTNE
jgi:hypothetical protein